MLLRNSFCKAKKLLHVVGFKSFRFGGYRKLPKTPFFSSSCSLEPKFNENFTQQDSFCNHASVSEERESTQDTPTTKTRRKKIHVKGKMVPNTSNVSRGSTMKFANVDAIEEREEEKIEEEEEDEHGCSCSQNLRTAMRRRVVQGLMELKRMDKSNVEHVLDIEEVLHYYCRITCTSYIDIFNKFFMEMYAEFVPSGVPCPCVSSGALG